MVERERRVGVVTERTPKRTFGTEIGLLGSVVVRDAVEVRCLHGQEGRRRSMMRLRCAWFEEGASLLHNPDFSPHAYHTRPRALCGARSPAKPGLASFSETAPQPLLSACDGDAKNSCSCYQQTFNVFTLLIRSNRFTCHSRTPARNTNFH